MKKQIVSYIFIVALITITIWIISSISEISKIPQLLSQTNKLFLSLGILSMIGYLFFDAIIINKLTKMVHKKGNILKSLKFTMIGQYYSAITPFSTGGQPAQIYSMVNESIPVGQATSILINKYIIYQIVVTIYSVSMFILKMGFVYSQIKTALPFVIIGITLNCFALVTILSLFLNTKLLRSIVLLSFKFAKKIKLVNDIEKYLQKIEYHMKEYKVGMKKIKTNWKLSLKIAFFTVIQLTLYFSITYFVYLALGFSNASYIDIISIQALLYMAVSFIPTPGTVGASEGGFYLLFKVFFANNVLIYAIILWRIISYYLKLVLSGMVTLVDYILRKNKKLVYEE